MREHVCMWLCMMSLPATNTARGHMHACLLGCQSGTAHSLFGVGAGFKHAHRSPLLSLVQDGKNGVLQCMPVSMEASWKCV